LGTMYNFTSEVMASAGAYCDVVSCNVYQYTLAPDLASAFATTNRPVMITECSVHAGDLDHWATRSYPFVATQVDRATAATTFFNSFATNANIVGFHWFAWADESIAGNTWEGENFNCGFVSTTDRPYTDLIGAITSFSTNIYNTRGGNVGTPAPELSALRAQGPRRSKKTMTNSSTKTLRHR